MQEEEEKMFCPHCNEQIEYLHYDSQVQERGTIQININEDGEVEQGDMDTDDAETIETDTECPHCEHPLEPEDVIVKNKKERIQQEFKVGEKIKTVYGQMPGIVTEIEGTKIGVKMINGTHKGMTLMYRPKDLTKVDKTIEVDEGNSETDEKIIHKKEKEYFEIDPLFAQGSICPKCKHFFAEETRINLKETKGYCPMSYNEAKVEDTSTCPKCLFEFNRVEQYKKIIN